MSLARTKWRRASLIAGAWVLFVAASLQMRFNSNVPEEPRRKLLEIVSAEAGGWSSHDMPVGETEQLTDKVERVLRYDDVLYRRYRKGEQEFSIFVAFWKPGSVTPREVTFHTPDRCWVHAGWKRLKAESKYSLESGDASIRNIQRRWFVTPVGQRQNVVFWHVVDGQIATYSEFDAADDVSMLSDLFKYGRAMKREQYFFRISSPMNLEGLRHDAGFATILRELGLLGGKGVSKPF